MCLLANMMKIDPQNCLYILKLDLKIKFKMQKHQPMSAKKYEASKNRVFKLLESGFICVDQYLVWVYNRDLIPKSNENW